MTRRRESEKVRSSHHHSELQLVFVFRLCHYDSLQCKILRLIRSHSTLTSQFHKRMAMNRSMYARLALSALAAAAVAAQSPVQNGSIVTFGHARFSFYYENLVRLEYSFNETFDDRPSMAIVQRDFPVVPITVQQLNASSIQLSSSAVVRTYSDESVNPNRTCNPATYQPNTDQDGGSRSPNYPNGM